MTRKEHGHDWLGWLTATRPGYALFRVIHRSTRNYYAHQQRRAQVMARTVMPALPVVAWRSGEHSLIGLNSLCAGDFDRDWHLRTLAEWQPRATLIMNHSAYAQEVQDAFPPMLVIAREWPDDNSCRRWPDAPARAYQLASYYPDPRIILYGDNEPEYSATMAAWTVEYIKSLDDMRRSGVVVNGGMGGPDKQEWQSYLWPILEQLHVSNEWRKREGLPPVYLGGHSYFMWKDPFYPGYNPLEGAYWLNGRYRMAYEVCDERGVSRPPFISTEGGSDDLRSEYHGWRAEPNPLSPDEFADRLERMVDGFYRLDPDVVAYLLFGWDSGPAMNGSWPTFDTRNQQFLNRMIAYGMRVGAETTEGEVTDTTTMTVTVLQTTRKRAAPNLLATQTGSLAAGTYTLEVGEEVQTDGYCWRYFVDGDGSGWYSATGPLNDPQAYIALAVVVPDPDPEPEPEPEPEPTPDPMTAERWLPLFQCWLDTLTAWEVHIAVQKESIAACETSVTALKGILRETIDGLVVSEE